MLHMLVLEFKTLVPSTIDTLSKVSYHSFLTETTIKILSKSFAVSAKLFVDTRITRSRILLTFFAVIFEENVHFKDR